MHRQGCLTSIAQFEFNALVQETKSAVQVLGRQRQSVAQALATAQDAYERSSHPPDETAVEVARLLDRLHRLNAVLDQVMRAIEDMEATPSSPDAEPLIVLRLPFTHVPSDKHLT